ncbi:SIMPL domain-containing protein [Enterococcus saccharolyticus]|uniref:SIMPL domain-containing protein n=1 Tax=Enterococcus saccharolyticus TaxID=41997 RepID=UPI001E499081|nr:SIMPL domain-containing protein [Enterococcus saccharolyticus]MCD5001817.1 SIMPL domain-containing protein [Enterococcus saccharolyticus]
MEKQLTVKGLGRVKVTPNVAIVTLRVTTTQQEYEQLLSEVNQRMQRLETVLLTAGLSKEDIKTTAFSIHPKEKMNQENEWQLVGYEAYQEITLHLTLEQAYLTTILTAVAESGVHPVLSVQFTVAQQEVVEQQLLLQATENGRRQAELLAEAANVQLGELLQIEYTPRATEFLSSTMLQSEKISHHLTIPMLHPADIIEEAAVTFIWQIEEEK